MRVLVRFWRLVASAFDLLHGQRRLAAILPSNENGGCAIGRDAHREARRL